MISLEEAKRISEGVSAEAKSVLLSFPIIKMLETYGEVEIMGSFVSNTMLKRDIDIFVYSEKLELKEVIPLVSKFLFQENVRRFSFANRLHEDRETYKYGFYVKVKYLFNGNSWSFDIHFTLPNAERLPEEKRWEGVTEDQKNQIILLKAQLQEVSLYPASPRNHASFYSKEIFEAVVQDNAKTIEDLQFYRKSHPFPKAHFE